MLDADARIELLINRKLDARLTEDEELELDRALLRSRRHRQMLDLTQRVDALCSKVLIAEVKATTTDTSGESAVVGRIGARHRRGRWWWLVPAALAACLGWMVWTGHAVAPESDDPGQLVENRPGESVPVNHPAASDRHASLGPKASRPDLRDPSALSAVGDRREAIRRVSTGSERLSRQRHSDVYGIVGDDGQIYVIELERTRTVRVPRRTSKMRLVRDEL